VDSQIINKKTARKFHAVGSFLWLPPNDLQVEIAGIFPDPFVEVSSEDRYGRPRTLDPKQERFVDREM